MHSSESTLLGGGALLDVIGARHYMIPSQVMLGVLAEYPRDGFREEIVGAYAPDRTC